MIAKRPIIVVALACAAGMCGCQGGDNSGLNIAMMLGDAGVISSDEARYMQAGLNVAGKAWELEQLTPENEHYIGRAVAARLIARFGMSENGNATRYVNLVGQSLAMGSDMPETFDGYRFIILDSDDVNAFAAPGGFVLVTRGMLRVCKSEDALAAVLAHEVAHVQNRDGLNALKNSQFWGTVAKEGLNVADQNIGALTEAFNGLIDQFVDQIIVKGYSRDAELRADRDAVTILKRVGYNANSMIAMLDELQAGWKPSIGMLKTHPSPDQRLAKVRPLVAESKPAPHVLARQKRFNQAMNPLLAQQTEH